MSIEILSPSEQEAYDKLIHLYNIRPEQHLMIYIATLETMFDIHRELGAVRKERDDLQAFKDSI